MYLYQISSGPGTNQVVTFKSTKSAGFGGTLINDWDVRDKPDFNKSGRIARATGMHFQADQAGPGWFFYSSFVFMGPG